MVSLMGKPLLQHTLEALRHAKFSHVIIVIAKDSLIPQQLKDIPGLSVAYVVQNKPLGMGHALLQVEKRLEETFFLLSGYHVDIADFSRDMMKMQDAKEKIVLLAKDDTFLEQYGVLETDGDKVLSVVERPKKSGKMGLRVVGMYLLNKTFMQTLRALPLEHYHFEKALDTYAKLGHIVYCKTEKPTITLKYGWDLLQVKDYLLSKIKRSISPKSYIAKNAIIEGNVVVSDNVRILEGTCIKGPCFLGENVIIGNNAILRNGVVIESLSVVGATMEVKNSLLMTKTTTHTGFIGDSIIGAYSRLAAGFCSANVRFDRKEVVAKVKESKRDTQRIHMGAVVGEYVDTGINVSTMPGITIGNHVTIGPGTTVMENVDDGVVIYTKFNTVIKKKSHNE